MLDKVIRHMERYAGLLLVGFLAFVAAAFVGSVITDAGSDTPLIWVLIVWGMLITGTLIVILTTTDVLLAASGTSPIEKGVLLLKTNQELVAASLLAFVSAAIIGSLTVDAGSKTPEIWLVYIWALVVIGVLILIGVWVDTTLDFLFTSFIGASLKRLRENQRLLMVGMVGAVAPALIGAITGTPDPICLDDPTNVICPNAESIIRWQAGTDIPVIWLAVMWISLAVSAVILVSVIAAAVVEGSGNTVLGKLVATLNANRRVALASFLGFAGAAAIGSLTVDAGTDISAIWLAAMGLMLVVGTLGIAAVIIQGALVVVGQGSVPERETDTNPSINGQSAKRKTGSHKK